ncbi:hypothetical protein DICPUDRAFT_74614 [Dictyostelium purpureum]|uniref:NADP-dependent oxidoreductase domain-containing protein n=1 Tax=Dictyostelium purpureum TaxID=5786 RepID=F0Z894_DICPU|nr:uncharacterized protein DICPUDRAFT_74614 [Dictyostelium purpureum]EGC39854.1 hypothetical protein DICPUDRAFT_74614 [Dictyostelium purpureum]|eukprot:XP_003283605.1 hypothetical protein DICPUDRAFT_74614 [Dictyostelium purpureum]
MTLNNNNSSGNISPTTTLKNGVVFPKIINGMWQMAGGHGKVNYKNALSDMIDHVNHGFNCFDMADHYGPAEDIFGELKTQLKSEESKKHAIGFTKWFPRPGNMTLENVRTFIHSSLIRTKSNSIDLLQFHWWDYDDERYLNAVQSLKQLQSEGLIDSIGLTNFDTTRLKIIVDSGVDIVSSQVSYSIIDRRAKSRMTQYCRENNIYILAYGVCLGGLLSEKFLGVPEPSQIALNTWSLSKYKDSINRWGNWNLFQELLEVLKTIGLKYSVSLTLVAIRYVLQQEMVGGVVIGCRFGIHQHIDENKRLFTFKLEDSDIKQIDRIALKGDCMLGWVDCGDEYR